MPICTSAIATCGASSSGAAACMPSQSPIVHWSPSHLFMSANIGPIAWRIDWPQAGVTSEAKNGGSSQTLASHLARPGIGGQPGREHAAGGVAADDRRATDHQVDEAHEVVAHVVERVAAGRPRRTALPAQIDGEDLEVLGQQGHRILVGPPRVRLRREAAAARAVRATPRWRSSSGSRRDRPAARGRRAGRRRPRVRSRSCPPVRDQIAPSTARKRSRCGAMARSVSITAGADHAGRRARTRRRSRGGGAPRRSPRRAGPRPSGRGR